MIQPHGVLLGVDKSSQRICWASRNVSDHFGLDANHVLERRLLDLLGPPQDVERIFDPRSASDWSDQLSRWRHLSQLVDHEDKSYVSLISDLGNIALLELLPQESDLEINDALSRDLVNEISYGLPQPDTAPALAEFSVEVFQKLTGFDNVVMYYWGRFSEGRVLAERSNSDVSLIDFWFDNRSGTENDPDVEHVPDAVHLVVDAKSDGVPVVRSVKTADVAKPVECALALPTTKHARFMEAIGFRSSLIVELKQENEDWGFIGCFNREPRRLSARKLQLCDVLSGSLPIFIERLETTRVLGRTVEAERLAYSMEQLFSDGDLLIEQIEARSDDIMKVADADALVIKFGDVFVEIGDVPIPPLEFKKLRPMLADGVAVSNRLHDIIDMSSSQIEVSAGGAYLELGDDGDDYVFFVRKELPQSIRWLSDDNDKPADLNLPIDTKVTQDGAYQQTTIKGQSKRFADDDREVFRILRRALFAVRSREREIEALKAERAAKVDRNRMRLALFDAIQTNTAGELASAISHELNQPIASIANYVAAVRKQLSVKGSDVPEDLVTLMDNAISESHRAGSLLHRLRGFVESGELKPSAVNLMELVEQSVDIASEIIGSDPDQISITIDTEVQTVQVDRLQIEQVLLNLIRNAVQASGQNNVPIIEIAINAAASDQVAIAIKDHGSGIPDDMIDTMFLPFHSARSTGMGFGLALCASIVEAHGGTIKAENWAKGAIVTFTLAIGPADPEETCV